MATLPAYNPTVPYLALIPGGLKHGLMVRIKGQMPHFLDRFSINIQTGPALRPSDDVNLHLSVRPNEQAIIRNHKVNQTYGQEERHGGCPIVPGSPFEILILAEATSFKIAINGTHYCEFVHRIPLTRAQYVYIYGDGLTVNSMLLEGDTQSAPPTHYIPPGKFPSINTGPYIIPGGVPVYPPSAFGQPGYNPGQAFGQPGYNPPPPPYSGSGYPSMQPNPTAPHYYGAPGAFPSAHFLRKEIKDEF